MDGGSDEEERSVARQAPGILLESRHRDRDTLLPSGGNMQHWRENDASSLNESDWDELQWDDETDSPWHLRGEESTVSFQTVVSAPPLFYDREKKAMDEFLSARLIRDTLPEDTPLPTFLAFREPRCPSPESFWDAPTTNPHHPRRFIF